MPELHIPLEHGQHEGIDPKLLPQGLLTAASNIRFRKDGRIGSRYGYNPITGAPSGVVASGAYSNKHAVLVTARTNVTAPAKWTDYRDDGSFSTAVAASSVGDLGVPERSAVVRNLRYQCAASDTATLGTNPYLLYAFHDYDLTSNAGGNGGATALVVEPKSGRQISSTLLHATGTNPKCVTVGSVSMVFYNVADVITVSIFSGSTLAVTATANVITAQASRGPHFDVAAYDSTKCLLVYNKSAVLLAWGTVDTNGTFTEVATETITNSLSRASIVTGSSGRVCMGWIDGASLEQGSAYFKSWTIAGTIQTAKTTVHAANTAAGYPVIGSYPAGSDGAVMAWNVKQSTATGPNGTGVSINAGAAGYLYGVALTTKPFTGPNDGVFMWVVTRNELLNAIPDTGGAATNYLIDVGQTQLAICEAVACQLEAFPGNYQISVLNGTTIQTYTDPRRNVVSVAALSEAPSMTAFLALLPVATSAGFGADAVRMENGLWADRLLPANINGQLFLSGSRLREFDGSLLYESGLMQGPERVRTSSSGTGTLSGTFQHVVTWEWTDALGNRHRSPPSEPETVTLTNALQTQVLIQRLPFSGRLGGQNGAIGIYANIWRTRNNEDIFYLVNVDKPLRVSPESGSTWLQYLDTVTDAALITHEVLYTQGDRGGLSGLLPNDEPPPCKYIWAGNDRLILGGLEDANAVQWSKRVYPGEPMQFSAEASFRARIHGRVTAVASMDGIWYVGSREGWWAISGDGPDDNGQGSAFSAPVKLPSDIGCISQRSVIEIPQGLLFQGRSNRLYLLPRGGGSPQWVGQQVRDTLTTYPFIASATLIPEENTVRFLCLKSNVSAARIIVYDTRNGEWSVDRVDVIGVPHSTVVYDGKAMTDGAYKETSAYSDNGSVIQMGLTMGDVRPFGVLGTGRARTMAILGEYQSECQVVLEISYDGGQLFTPAGDWTFGPSGTAATAGETITLKHQLVYPRGPAFRPRITVTPVSVGEALVLNAVSFEVYQQPGLARKAAAYQR